MTHFTAAAYHHALTREFAERHFTDPEVSIDDAAAYAGLHPRTLSRSLDVEKTSWRTMLHELRMAQAQELLATTRYPIDDIALLCGYDSRSAFARAFKTTTTLRPSESRRAKKGPARAGGATGAFARRKKQTRPGIAGGADAVELQRMHEAQHRIEDRRVLDGRRPGASIEEIAAEIESPRRMREDPTTGARAVAPSSAGSKSTTCPARTMTTSVTR